MCQHGENADPYAELDGAIQRFVTRTHAADRTPGQAHDDLVRQRRLIDLLLLDFARKAARVEAGYPADDGSSLIPFLTHECRMAPGEASSALCVGQQMDTLELSVEAMREGHIGFAHLAHLAHTKFFVEVNGAHLDEARLLKRARVTSPNEFRRDCTHARHAADADRFREEEAAGTRESFLELRGPSDGQGMWLRGYLDPIAGATVRAALEPLARPRGADDHRSRGLRLADAAHEMARFTLNTGGEDAEGNLWTHCKVTHLMVTTTLETLTGQPGAPAGEIEGRIPISTATVQRFACSANVSRVLLGPDSAVIDVGRARRLPSPPQRRALAVRDGGCVWPGCTMRMRFTEPHHVLHWTPRVARQIWPTLSLCAFGTTTTCTCGVGRWCVSTVSARCWSSHRSRCATLPSAGRGCPARPDGPGWRVAIRTGKKRMGRLPLHRRILTSPA